MTQSSVYDLEIKKKVVRFIRMLLTGVVVFGFSNVHLLNQENLKWCYQRISVHINHRHLKTGPFTFSVLYPLFRNDIKPSKLLFYLKIHMFKFSCSRMVRFFFGYFRICVHTEKNKGKKQMVAKFYNTTRKSLRISYKINVFF